jgi:hypothetical protein
MLALRESGLLPYVDTRRGGGLSVEIESPLSVVAAGRIHTSVERLVVSPSSGNKGKNTSS